MQSGSYLSAVILLFDYYELLNIHCRTKLQQNKTLTHDRSITSVHFLYQSMTQKRIVNQHSSYLTAHHYKIVRLLFRYYPISLANYSYFPYKKTTTMTMVTAMWFFGIVLNHSP